VRTRTEAGASTEFFYNQALGMSPAVAERDGDTGAMLRYYVWTPEGRLLYMIDAAHGNAVRFVHCDQVGSTLALTDAGGELTDAYAYDPYGRLQRHEGDSPQPFTFVGAWGVRQEGAGGDLYQMRARTYDASTGRFLSPEPLWPDLFDPKALNPYAYAGGDPVRFIDPTGLLSQHDELMAMLRQLLENLRRQEAAQREGERGRENQSLSRKGDATDKIPNSAPPQGAGQSQSVPDAAPSAEDLQRAKVEGLGRAISTMESFVLDAAGILQKHIAERDLLLGQRESARKPHKIEEQIKALEEKIARSMQAMHVWMQQLQEMRAEQMAMNRGLGGK
jgi:RHS repeat-associated protein